MQRIHYILIAIAILVALIAIFIISFVAYRRTPAPKGCEDLKPESDMCSQCQKTSCAFYEEYHKENDEKDEQNKGDK